MPPDRGAQTRQAPPGIGSLMLVRWIREAISNLLPLTNIAGILAGIRLLCRRGMRAVTATTATVVDMSIELSTQVGFALLGLALLVLRLAPDAMAAPLLIGLGILVGMSGALNGALWLGFARLPERAAERLGLTGSAHALRRAIRTTCRMRRGLARSAALHLLAWLAGTLEVCIALHFLGIDVSLAEGFMIESLSQMLRTTAFAIPGALGIQEGGTILLCGVFGIGPEIALALSLMKRLREIVLGVPGIAMWLRLERRPRNEAVPAPLSTVTDRR